MDAEARTYILGIESSCDDTSAAVLCNDKVLANVVAGQDIHKLYGGVVPELASRAHMANIVPVVSEALRQANIDKSQLSAVAFTRGPGLMGALLVGTSFAKSLALALRIPLIEVNHMQAHVMAHFIADPDKQKPPYPFLCLTVSGGHTQIVKVNGYNKMEVLGTTRDDAVGEAFDKAAKTLGLPYPGGPLIDKYAALGNASAFKFPFPRIDGLDYSFSGLKTAILYFVRDSIKVDAQFLDHNLNDLCASIQHTIVSILIDKFLAAGAQTGITHLALAGGVSANSGLRAALHTECEKQGLQAYIPKFEYCTDNAAMIGIAGYYKFLDEDFAPQSITAIARYPI